MDVYLDGESERGPEGKVKPKGEGHLQIHD